MKNPVLVCHTVLELTAQTLREHSIRALLLDVDNTLALHGDPKAYPGTVEWAKKLSEEGFSLVIISNNRRERVEPFAAQYGVKCLSVAGKPFPKGFLRAAELAGVPKEACAVVGDQIFTDLLGAEFSEMKCILVDPLGEKEPGFVRLKRRAERGIRRRIDRKFGRNEK